MVSGRAQRYLLVAVLVLAGSISAYAFEAELRTPVLTVSGNEWQQTVPTFEEVLGAAPQTSERHRDRIELAACLAVVEAVKVAARRDTTGAQADAQILGAEFEHFLDRAEGLRARAAAYPEQTDPAHVQAFWDEMKANPKGRELRQAMVERLHGDEELAQRCIALPALVDQLEFEDWQSDQKNPPLTASTESVRGSGACAVSEPAATVPFRYAAAKVWTGAEVIYWGGSASLDSQPFYNTGFIYDYATDTWSILTGTGDIPSPRRRMYAVASANQFIVYSGSASMGSLAPTKNTGGVLDLTTREWSATSTTNAPIHNTASVVWTGSEMIIWGGFVDNVRTNTGARYNPTTNEWSAMSTTNAPTPRLEHSAVWTGSEMIVYGGSTAFQELALSGARYNPSNNTWTGIQPTNNDLPEATARERHTAVWTGTDMLVFGGSDADFNDVAEGLRYNLASNSWSAMAAANQPSARTRHGAEWTGTEMIIWGGITSTVIRGGAAYNPTADSWRTMPQSAANSTRADFLTAFTNSNEMLVFGNRFQTTLSAGELYDTATNEWGFMSTQISQESPGALAYWDFNEFSIGQSIPDGTRVADTCDIRDARAVGQPEVTEGVRSDLRALEFESASNDRVVFEPGYTFGDGGPNAGTEFDFAFDENFTIETIIQIPEGSTQTGSLVAKDAGAGEASWWLRVNNGVLEALIDDGEGNPTSITGNTPVNSGHWHHVALVRDAIARSVRLYVDYKLDATVSDTTVEDINTPSGTDIVVGAFSSGDSQLQGDVELARIARGRLLTSEFALADEVVGVAVSITTSDYLLPGGNYAYEVVVSNAGPASATGMTVDVPLPAAFESAEWTCTSGSGASCIASGTGDIADTVDIPANQSVTYSIDAVVASEHDGIETINADTTLSGSLIDFNEQNNSATLIAVPDEVFRDRFEQP